MINTRKSSILGLLNKVGVEALSSALAERAEEAKNNFFSTLTAQKREAYKMTFLAILQERDILLEHEDKEVRSNWASRFIEFHDEMLTKVKMDSNKVSSEIIEDYGFDYVASTFIADTRNLEAIINETANAYKDAILAKEERQQELKKKLHTQLEEVAKTLHLLTSDSEAEVKRFEIETEQGEFNIKLGSVDSDSNVDCNCGNCNGKGYASLEDFIKELIK